MKNLIQKLLKALDAKIALAANFDAYLLAGGVA